jgi:hypothetical protein
LTECPHGARVPAPFSKGEEGSGEGTLLMEAALVVEIAYGTLHPRIEGTYRRLCAAYGIVQIRHGIPSLRRIVTVLGKIVYFCTATYGIMRIIAK